MKHVILSLAALVWAAIGTAQCTDYYISPSSANAGASGGLYNFFVSVPDGCTAYLQTGGCPWINNITTTNNTISFNITTNSACNSRSCSLYIVNSASQVAATYTVNQVGIGIPSTPGTISGSSVACVNSPQQYSVPNASGISSYTWSYSGTGTPSGTGTTISFGPQSPGTLSVVANNSCGTSSPRTLALTLGNVPGTPQGIVGTTEPCVGAPWSYSVPSVDGASSYTWSYLGDGTVEGTTTLVTLTAMGSGTLSVSATNQCGSGPVVNLPIEPRSLLPEPAEITGPPEVCINAAATYTVSEVPGATGYVWLLPASWSGASVSQTIDVLTDLAGGGISVAAFDICGAGDYTSFTVELALSTLEVGPITGPDQLCVDAEATFSLSPVSGATSYLWDLPDTWTGSSTTDSIVISTETGIGTIGVSVYDGCVYSPMSNLSVSNLPVPGQPSAIIGGSLDVCAGATQVYSIPPVQNADSYAWTLPTGTWSGSSTTATIEAVVGDIGGPLQVAAVNGCGTGPARTAMIDVLICTSINEVANRGPWSIFPNPTNSNVTLLLDGRRAGEVVVEVLDTSGRPIRLAHGTSMSSTGTIQLDLGPLSAGHYYVRVTEQEHVQVLPLLKL